MELLDRYLHAVKFWLPRKHQEDIVAELREDIQSQIEEREAALGRPLDEPEVASMLKQSGHPMLVAGRYRSPGPVIGPALLPAYWFVLKLVLLWILAPLLGLILLGSIAAHGFTISGAGAAQIILAFWSGTFTAIGAITVVFAAIEKYQNGAKSLEKWDPRKLPRVRPGLTAQPTPRWNSIAELVFGGIFTVAYIQLFRTTFDFGEARITLAPIWRDLYWPFLALLLCGLVVALISLLRPSWVWLRSAARLTINAATLVLAGLLFRAGTWVDVAIPSLPADRVEVVARVFNLTVFGTLAIIAIVTVVDSIQEARRIALARRTRPQLATHAAGT